MTEPELTNDEMVRREVNLPLRSWLREAHATIRKTREERDRYKRKFEAEYHDVQTIAREVALVYDHITGGRISKANTDHGAVIAEHDDRCHEHCYDREQHEIEIADLVRERDTARSRVQQLEEEFEPDSKEYLVP